VTAKVRTQERSLTCAATIRLRFDELLVLARLQSPSMSVGMQQACGLEAAHRGPHQAYVQTDEGFLPDGSGQEWWITWTKGCRRLQPLPGCEMTEAGKLASPGQGDCLLAEHHPGAHSFELRTAPNVSGPQATTERAGGVGAPLQKRIASQGATPAQAARVLSELLGGRHIGAADLDELPPAEALVLDVLLERWTNS
jgi:hypothetical protein